MQKFIELGQTPYNETPAQVGDPNYRVNAVRQCQSYIQAIRNYLGHEPDGALLEYRSFAHESGTYYEVICSYDPSVQAARDYASRCARQAPSTWADGGVRPPPCEAGRGWGR